MGRRLPGGAPTRKGKHCETDTNPVVDGRQGAGRVAGGVPGREPGAECGTCSRRGHFTVTNTITSGANVEGSLAEAIQDANENPGADTIRFNIPGSGVKTIALNSGLPSITEAVTIDGYSQPGSRPNTLANGTDAVILVQIDGSNAGSTDGLDIRASNVVVRGLAINRFAARSGIDISSGTGSRIEGNFIGADASGTVARGNSNGVFVSREAGNVTIGGSSAFQRNLISGNTGSGFGAVTLRGRGSNKVLGNLIGTKKDGTTSLANAGAGVEVSSPLNRIGGVGLGEANTIAFNSKQGVRVDDFNPLGSTGNRIQANSMFSNGLLGIDLLAGEDAVEGPTPNDAGDPDVGANGLQNKPNLNSAVTAGGKTTIQGRLRSTPNKLFVVEVFFGGNEGRTFLGNRVVTTDANGNASFTFVPSQVVPVGQSVTATATDSVKGDTSEFSGPRTVTTS